MLSDVFCKEVPTAAMSFSSSTNTQNATHCVGSTQCKLVQCGPLCRGARAVSHCAAAAAPSAAGAVAATGSSCWRKAATRCRRAVSRRVSWRAACSSAASATSSVPPTASSPPRLRAGSSAAAGTPARRPCRGGRPGRQDPIGCTCTSPLSRFSRSCILDIASETSDEAGAAAPPPRHCLPAPRKARPFGSFSEAWSSARSSSTFRGPRYISSKWLNVQLEALNHVCGWYCAP